MRLAALVLALSASALAQPAFTFGGGPWAPLAVVGQTDDTAFATGGGSLYASSDGGLNWTVRADAFAPRDVEAAADGTLWAASADGVSRSADGGATWTLDRAGSALDVAVDGDDVYAVVAGLLDVLRRRDATWTPLNAPVADPDLFRTVVSVAARGGRVAVGTSDTSTFASSGTTFVRDADDQPWRAVPTGPPARLAIAPSGDVWAATGETRFLSNTNDGAVLRIPPGATSATTVRQGTGGDVRVLADGSIAYTSGVSVYRGAPDPAFVASLPEVPRLGRLAVLPSGLAVTTLGTSYIGIDPPSYVSSGSGTYAVLDGRAVHAGAVGADVFALALDADGRLLAGGTAGTVHRLDGDAWTATPASLALVRAFATLPGGPAPLAVGAAEVVDGVGSPFAVPSIRSVTDGQAALPWEGFAEVAGVASVGSRLLVLDASRFIYSGASGLFALDASSGAVTSLIDAQGLRTLARFSDETGFVGAWGPIGPFGGEPSPTRAWRSTDGGATWAPDDAGLAGREVYAFAQHDGRTLAGTDAGVFARGADGTWAPAGLDALAVRAFAAASDTLLAGTSDGLFRADDAAGWARYGTGLDGRTVFAILPVEAPGGRVVAVGTDRGVWATARLATVDAPPPPAAAKALSVAPNPVRGPFTLDAGPAWAGATAVVVDALGRRAAGPLALDATGRLRVPTDGWAAGVYVARVTHGARVQVRRLSVVR